MWGWHDVAPREELCTFDNDGYWNLESTFRGLGLNPHPISAGGHNKCYWVEHYDANMKDEHDQVLPTEEQTYKVGEKMYHVSSAPWILDSKTLTRAKTGHRRKLHVCNEPH